MFEQARTAADLSSTAATLQFPDDAGSIDRGGIHRHRNDSLDPQTAQTELAPLPTVGGVGELARLELLPGRPADGLLVSSASGGGAPPTTSGTVPAVPLADRSMSSLFIPSGMGGVLPLVSPLLPAPARTTCAPRSTIVKGVVWMPWSKLTNATCAGTGGQVHVAQIAARL